jgi:hypothetical protein
MIQLITPVGMAMNNEKKMYGCKRSATRIVIKIRVMNAKKNDQSIG